MVEKAGSSVRPCPSSPSVVNCRWPGCPFKDRLRHLFYVALHVGSTLARLRLDQVAQRGVRSIGLGCPSLSRFEGVDFSHVSALPRPTSRIRRGGVPKNFPGLLQAHAQRTDKAVLPPCAADLQQLAMQPSRRDQNQNELRCTRILAAVTAAGTRTQWPGKIGGSRGNCPSDQS